MSKRTGKTVKNLVHSANYYFNESGLISKLEIDEFISDFTLKLDSRDMGMSITNIKSKPGVFEFMNVAYAL